MLKRLMKWLPQPSSKDIDDLRDPSRVKDDIDLLVRLSRFDWDVSRLRRLGRLMTAASVSANSVEQLKRNNIQPVRLLMFSNATAKHLAESILGIGIRHGLLIDTLIVEYEEPEAYLARNWATVQSFAPDIVVLNIDAHAFALTPVLGNPESADEVAGRATDRIKRISKHLREAVGKTVILQTISTNPDQSRLHADRFIYGSHKDLINRVNTKIAGLARATGDLVLDVASVAENIGLENWFSPRYWAVAKYPFAPELAPLYAEHLCRLIAVSLGKSRRVLVLDLDNTLWGGVLGDDGKDHLVLGSGSPVGEAHRAVQTMAKSLRDRGIVLCVSSKNEESVALDAFRTHPEMVLSDADIAVFQINWKDKAANIAALADILNLGLDSFVFLDDNPAERAQVRFALPDVAVPELPKDVTEWLAVFQAACYFEVTGYTQEDRERADYYRANAKRSAQIQSFAGHGDYLKSLNMEMIVRPFDRAGRKRITQLIAKSNQFNLTTKRYSEVEVAATESDPSLVTLQVRLSDIFGDNGMISVVIANLADEALEIDTWLMSCRVLGRGVEEAVLDWLVGTARRIGKSLIKGVHIPTKKNMMVADHYKKLGFSFICEESDGTTHWQLAVDEYHDKKPPIRTLEMPGVN